VALIAPPIAACFLFGIFWNRVNGTGAVASLVTGLALGAFRFVVEVQNKIARTVKEPGTKLARVIQAKAAKSEAA
jgi:Na+/proline symporter